MNKTLTLMLLAVVMTALSFTLLAKSELPQVTPDGLELVEKDSRGYIYAAPDIDWGVYDRILLDQATVSFRKNWQRDQNRNAFDPFKVKASDMEKIKKDLSELFDQVFTEELTGNGDYIMATESDQNVMRISPQIVDLDVYAPDTPTAGMQRSYTNQAGRMTLKLDIYDSVTGDLLASASDRKEAPHRGYMQWTTSVSNYADARRMLQAWAKDLRKRLDEARGIAD